MCIRDRTRSWDSATAPRKDPGRSPHIPWRVYARLRWSNTGSHRHSPRLRYREEPQMGHHPVDLRARQGLTSPPAAGARSKRNARARVQSREKLTRVRNIWRQRAVPWTLLATTLLFFTLWVSAWLQPRTLDLNRTGNLAEWFAAVGTTGALVVIYIQLRREVTRGREAEIQRRRDPISCLLYTSDAADEEDSVDLGGRRIIKKKTK